MAAICAAAVMIALACFHVYADQPNIARPNWIGGSNDQRIYFGSGLKLYGNGSTNTYYTNLFDLFNANTSTSRFNIANLQTSGISSGAVLFFTNGAWSTSTTVGSGSTLPTTWTNVNNASQTISYSGSNVFFNADSGQVGHVSMSTNLYFNVPSNLKVGTYVFFLYQDATGSRTALWTNRFKWHNGTAPTLSTNALYTNLISFVCNGTNLIGGTAVNVQ